MSPTVDEDDAAHWRQLHRRLIELRAALEQSRDPLETEALRRELDVVREQIGRLEADRTATQQDGSALPSEGVEPPSRPERSNVDELLGSLTGGHESTRSSGRSTAEVPSVVEPEGDQRRTSRVVVVTVALGLFSLIGLVSLQAVQVARARGDDALAAADSVLPTSSVVDLDHEVGELQAMFSIVGLDDLTVEARDDLVYVAGPVATETDRQSATSVAVALIGLERLDLSGIVVEEPSPDVEQPEQIEGGSDVGELAVQLELDRLLSTAPLVFESGETELGELQLRVLNSVSALLALYSDVRVRVVGFTDDTGSDAANIQVSLARANFVSSYLVEQGVNEASLTVEGLGESESSGSTVLAGLERRVELDVIPGAGEQLARTLRIGVVAPSASNDLAFTQSIVDALDLVVAERGGVELQVVDNTFIPEQAAAAIRDFADQDYDLVIAHGVEFGAELIQLARDYPSVAFAWGTATETFDLPNLYAYDAAAEEGGYVMGAMSAMLSQTGTVGVVGPLEVGDAKRYVDGFAAGAQSASPPANVLITYTGSFGDVALAAEVAEVHLRDGADVLTGTAEMVVGAIAVAEDEGVLWFGTQADQASLAPSIVVASQVYHWEVVLRPIIADLDNDTVAGRALLADLANGGLVIEYNPSFDLPSQVESTAAQLVSDIIAGSITIPAS